MDRKKLYVDMDGTLAVFNNQIESEEVLFRQGYFRDLKPHSNVVAAVKELTKHSELEVFILSSVLPSQYARQEKKEWLDKYIPEIDSLHRIFVPCGEDKGAYIGHILSENDLLFDDYSVNLHSWCPPGLAVKLVNGINGNYGTWKGEKISHLDSPEKISKIILGEIENGKQNQAKEAPASLVDFYPQLSQDKNSNNTNKKGKSPEQEV